MPIQEQCCSSSRGSFLPSALPLGKISCELPLPMPIQDSKKMWWLLYVIVSAILVAAVVCGGGGDVGGGDVGDGSGPSRWSISCRDMVRYGRPDSKKIKPLPPPKKPEVNVKNIQLKLLPGEPRLEHTIVACVWPRGFCLEEEGRRVYVGTVPQEEWRVHGVWPPDQRASLDIKFDDRKVLQNKPLLNEAKYKWPNLTHFAHDPSGHLSFWRHEWENHGVKSGLEQEEYMKLTLLLYDIHEQNLHDLLDESKNTADMKLDRELGVYTHSLRVGKFHSLVSMFMQGRSKLMCKKIMGDKLILTGIQ